MLRLTTPSHLRNISLEQACISLLLKMTSYLQYAMSLTLKEGNIVYVMACARTLISCSYMGYSHYGQERRVHHTRRLFPTEQALQAKLSHTHTEPIAIWEVMAEHVLRQPGKQHLCVSSQGCSSSTKKNIMPPNDGVKITCFPTLLWKHALGAHRVQPYLWVRGLV